MVIVFALLLAILFFVLGIAIVGFVFKLFWWLVVGIVIGALARLVLPGVQPIGALATALIGIAGSLLGGILADSVFDVGSFLQFVISVGVAVVLVALFAESAGPRSVPGQGG